MYSPEPSSSSSPGLARDKRADGERNDIAIEIEAMLNKAEAPIKTDCCIYKVPHEIRKLNEDVYTPKVISIGPFHHQNQSLQKMESQKKIYLKRFLQRSETKLDSFVNCVEELESRIRGCYSQDINFFKEDFVKMILLDAGFILEFFIILCDHRQHKKDDALLLETWLMSSIIRDLCLLENQLPFFVLDELYNLAFPDSSRGNIPTFLDLTFKVLAVQNEQNLVAKFVTVYHFTDFLRTSHLQAFDKPLENGREVSTNLNTVNELCEAGIKFKANRKSLCLLDLQFSDRTLKIPQLILYDGTEMLFCNMIALEQCHYLLQQFITDYICVLSCLIKTDEDADVLVKNGIIVNHFNRSNNMVRLFYRLGKSAPILSLNSAYYPLVRQLKIFCKAPFTRRKASLRRDYYMDLKRTYCKTPLQTLATLGGIFLLILTLIQTVCSILQVT